MLVEKSLRDLLADLASPNPTPGGGSASALASAAGVSLLMMVASLPRTRTGAPEERPALTTASSGLADVQRRLAEAIDADAVAYDRVVAAYKMGKATDAERAARKTAVQAALAGAIDVPLLVMRWSAAALERAPSIAAHGQRAAASDVGVAIRLLDAGFHGARLNVEANLGDLNDATFRNQAAAEVGRLAASVAASIEAAEKLLRG